MHKKEKKSWKQKWEDIESGDSLEPRDSQSRAKSQMAQRQGIDGLEWWELYHSEPTGREEGSTKASKEKLQS